MKVERIEIGSIPALVCEGASSVRVEYTYAYFICG